jgi:hypothetical protein
MGVEEHFFAKEAAPGAFFVSVSGPRSYQATENRGVKDFWIYDVPGSRGARPVW